MPLKTSNKTSRLLCAHGGFQIPHPPEDFIPNEPRGDPCLHLGAAPPWLRPRSSLTSPVGPFPPPPRRPRCSQACSPGSTRCTFARLLQPPSLPPVERHLFVTLQTLGSRLQARVMQEGIYIDLAHAYQEWMMQTSRNLRVREAYKGL